jgi:glutamine cyclotransferase
LYESDGLNRDSTIRKLNSSTGVVIEQYPINNTQWFAEGLTIIDGKVYQLTYKAKKGYVYNVEDLSKPLNTFDYDTVTGEGWGLTYDHDNNEMVVSDGSEYLLFWDPDTFLEKRRVEVKRMNGANSKNINELEYFHGRVLANVWFEDIMLVINPETGIVEKEYGKFRSCPTASSEAFLNKCFIH